MYRIHRCIRPVSIFMCFALLALSVHAPAVRAGPVSTTDVPLPAKTEDERSRLHDWLARAEVKEALLKRGVDPAQVQARADALTDAEASALAGNLDQLPAGEGNLPATPPGFQIAAAEDVNTALWRAAKQGDAKTVLELLDKGADINANAGGTGSTPLIVAAIEGQAAMVKLLLDKGAKINARDKHDYTALIFAASKGRAGVVKILLERGADLKASNDVGLTALRAAELFGHAEVVEMLAKAGAKE